MPKTKPAQSPDEFPRLSREDACRLPWGTRVHHDGRTWMKIGHTIGGDPILRSPHDFNYERPEVARAELPVFLDAKAPAPQSVG